MYMRPALQQMGGGCPRSRVSATATLLSIVACVLMWSGAARAQQSCEITENATVGQWSGPDSHTFGAMSSITGVQLLSTNSGYSCPTNKYSFSGNILSTSRRCRGTFAVTGLQAGCTAAQSDQAIAQGPLFLTQQAEPNVMFLIDDSGSMRFEMMPDALTTYSGGYTAYWLYPRADGVYGGSGEYANYVVSVEDNDVYNARARSPQFNKIYYDPGVTYRPWVKHDGSAYAPASPTCAFHNPERTGTGEGRCRNLTVDNDNQNSNCWITANAGSSHCSNRTFWPALYFWHDGSASALWSNFAKVRIAPGIASYSGHGREYRTDCADAANGICTYSEEIQNFANWYTYYRSRILAARAGIGLAFSQQGSGMRVGFGAINEGSNSVDGVSTSVVMDGVRRFEGDAREDFFERLYTHPIPSAGTPLRNALDAAGQYFMRSDDRGPWGETPGTDSDTPQLACRRCYTVLMTDGYWSGGSDADADTSGARANNDGSNGSVIVNHRPDGSNYTYQAADPFQDNRSNTLADVAMHYWKNDLRPGADGLQNVVGPTATNPAFWQHMTTYGVGLGVLGSIDPAPAFAAATTGAALTWPDTDQGTVTCSGSTCEARIDDLLHAAVNSRGGFFSAADPNAFASELSQVLQDIVIDNRSSASAIAANSTRLDQGTLIYQASFNGLYWSGELRAFRPDQATGQVDEESPVWDTDNAGTFAAHAVRNIFTANGLTGSLITGANAGVAFTWGSLSSAQQGLLQPADSRGAQRLDWLRGDRSLEGSVFRERQSVLGDIINSDPAFVGASEDYGYRTLPGTEGASYAAFMSNDSASGGKANRTPMIYVGANDGMLHGFHAETGVEKFGFVPAGVFANLHELTAPDYQHRYFVDGSPRAGDAYLGGAWKTVLLGSTGAGGRSVFALDVTNPSAVGPTSLLWEFSTAPSDTHKLGVTIAQPSMARVKAGDKWIALFGNGYESGDNVKLLVVDLATGSLIKAIDTQVSGAGNGLGTPVPVDVDNDRITDYVYAGDLDGNLWRFDFTGNNSNQWSVSKLFSAVDGAGDAQPITARPAVGRHPDGGLMIYFGTGQYFQVGDAQRGATSQVQSLYGIRDNGGALVARAALVRQEITFEGVTQLVSGDVTPFEVRMVSNNSAENAPSYGWYMDLVPPNGSGQGERVVSTPLVRHGRVIFSTVIPSDDPCGYGGESWLMELDAVTGGSLPYEVIDVNGDGVIDASDKVAMGNGFISGKHSQEMHKTPGIVEAGGDKEFKYQSGSSGTVLVTTEKGGGGSLGRQSWRQYQ